MEWVTGVKLTTLPSDEVRSLVGVGQEAFLVQLLEVGFFHGDPHPGNLLKVRSLSPTWRLFPFLCVAVLPASFQDMLRK
jgi:predicted unusual protein kinase regulating ubiquinone biosynthesis (AarF/ABC1/UbiB family)